MMVTKATTVVESRCSRSIDIHNHLGGGKAHADAATCREVPRGDGRGRRRRPSSTSTAAGATGSRRRSRPSTRPTPAGSSPSPWSTSTASTSRLGRARGASGWRESFKAGAKGLKFHKTLGLGYRYKDGRLMPVDDPKLDPIWEVCGQHRPAGR